MKLFEKLKARREAKKANNPDHLYDEEELTLLKRMKDLDRGSEEYKECQSELKNIHILRAESRESKRRISKQDKGGILIKTLGIFGAALGVGSIIWSERQGMTFTGEKRSIMDAIARGIGNIFVKR